MTRVAVLTYGKRPQITEDDARIASVASSLELDACPWDDPTVDWAAYDAILVRSCWNYDEAPADFAAWLDRIEAGGIPLWNSAPTLRWNADKRYLRELADRGHRTVETRWIEPGAEISLADVLHDAGWERVVVKPTVSASAKNTWPVSRDDAARHEAEFARLVGSRAMMVQPFLPEIVDPGEWSILFFGGRFSHAVVKRPKPNDFRVQEEFGGRTETATPPRSFLEDARRLLEELPEMPIYARVDGVELDGRFALMELELIEPCLFLGNAETAPQAFVEALERAAGEL